jgi:hypothetical protein
MESVGEAYRKCTGGLWECKGGLRVLLTPAQKCTGAVRKCKGGRQEVWQVTCASHFR